MPPMACFDQDPELLIFSCFFAFWVFSEITAFWFFCEEWKSDGWGTQFQVL